MLTQIIAFGICIVLFGLIISNIIDLIKLDNLKSNLKNYDADEKEASYLAKKINNEKRIIYNMKINNSHRLYSADNEKHGELLRRIVNLNCSILQYKELQNNAENKIKVVKSINKEMIKSILVILFYILSIIFIIELANGNLQVLYL